MAGVSNGVFANREFHIVLSCVFKTVVGKTNSKKFSLVKFSAKHIRNSKFSRKYVFKYPSIDPKNYFFRFEVNRLKNLITPFIRCR